MIQICRLAPKKVATSRDGSTIAAVVSDSVTQNSTLYVFDAATGAVRQTWTDTLRMDEVDLTDNGSIALVTQDNQATLIDTATAGHGVQCRRFRRWVDLPILTHLW